MSCPPDTSPPPPPGGAHLPCNGLLAGSAQPFGSGGDPLAAEVRLQHDKHAVQVPTGLARGRLGGRSRGAGADGRDHGQLR